MRTLLLIIAVVLLAAGLLYLTKRITQFFKKLSYKWTLIVLSIITILSIIGSTVLFMTESIAGSIIYNISFVVLVFIGGLVLSSLVVDLLYIIFRLKPYMRVTLTLLINIAFITYGIVHAQTIQVKEITMPIKGLTKPVNAVLLTDIHLGNFHGERMLRRIVNKTLSLKPDIVFNTGDLFEGRVDLKHKDDLLAEFDRLDMPHYFVIGNHDEHVGTEAVLDALKSTNVIVLRNEIANLGELQIVGLDNMPADSTSSRRHIVGSDRDVESVLDSLDIDKDRPTIILHHRPDGVEYMEAKNADLLLAGHTHDGQIFPFNLIAEKMYKYNKGYYEFGNMKIYVSSGAGTVSFPIRIGTDSEITLLHLVPVTH